ncbi:uncharacterized protein MELLADRAFT_77012 [Melampsora larici-populina 98AG31]|uniref:Fatty acid hydroxylase domain-containing protein n=1 Tax=Melampsora larici-populina (strain 98AG31 / pathotype 3-4-7) TaxID=747676 RepID=F4RCE2_MELLP|nr:uncharacterized protein MELLADRAFT_77012 [Melampsora larici-populina 98AG31]EGG09714.1 hypothetical protein MELLADRAFT_77012 [Melampsora larici-populina 98AG31]
MLDSIWLSSSSLLSNQSSSTSSSSYLQDLITPNQIKFPIYHFHREEVIPGIGDNVLSFTVPLITYWVVSIFFTLIDYLQLPFIEKYRLHEPIEVSSRNRVTPTEVIKAVLIQQFIQTALAILVLDETGSILNRDYLSEMKPYALPVATLIRIILTPNHAKWVLTHYGRDITQWAYWWGVPIIQYLWASFIMDTWQYFWHRAFHINQFLYKHIHSVHHRLYCPYSFGALYNHPLEGFILDTLGALVAHAGSGMSIRQATVLFGLSTAKTVDDHCGLALPWDPFQHLFGNNADYHDIHHQQFGIKKNFSQPYFVHWDVLLGTRMTRKEVEDRFGKKSSSSSSRVTSVEVHTDERDDHMITTTSSSPASDLFEFKDE